MLKKQLTQNPNKSKIKDAPNIRKGKIRAWVFCIVISSIFIVIGQEIPIIIVLLNLPVLFLIAYEKEGTISAYHRKLATATIRVFIYLALVSIAMLILSAVLGRNFSYLMISLRKILDFFNGMY